MEGAWEEEAWQGEDPAGKTVCLVTEQGFGDAIQFLRFATALTVKGATVEVQCHPRLVPLFSTAPGISRVLSREDAPSPGATMVAPRAAQARLPMTMPKQ